MPAARLWGYVMTMEMIAPEWMHAPITAAEYDSWTADQCAGIEIVDGMVVASRVPGFAP